MAGPSMPGGGVAPNIQTAGAGLLAQQALSNAGSISGTVAISHPSGNDTIAFGSGADTVVHGTATVHAGGAGSSSLVSVGSGHATLLGGSATHAFTSIGGHSAVASHATIASAGAFGGAKLAATHTLNHFQGGAHINIVGYAPALPTAHGASSTVSMDHGLTKITLGNFSHASGGGFHH
ncbi:MAG TPA: hypothetical protein VII63_09000 [Caulobacteraceae bacterium]